MDSRIKYILDKIQSGKLLTDSEMEIIDQWLKDPDNVDALKEETTFNYMINRSLMTFDADKAFEKVENRIRKQPVVRKLNTVLRYAAAVAVIVLSAGYLFFNTTANTESNITIPDNQISIILESGEVKGISQEESFGLTDEKGQTIAAIKGDTLNYNTNKKSSALTYNTIHIPKGKTFRLKLSDGTYVYLNSGSELRYPVNFQPGERKVFLKGQAYFDVTKNKESQFIVATAHKEVLVYGTQFDVSAYPDDPVTKTALIEGSVGIREKGETGNVVRLKPDQMAKWNNTKEQHIAIEAVDAAEYSNWILGRLTIDNKDFSEVLRILERKYNVTITNEYEAINKQRFHGTFSNESLTDILDVFTGTMNIEYSLNGDNIIIKEAEQNQ